MHSSCRRGRGGGGSLLRGFVPVPLLTDDGRVCSATTVAQKKVTRSHPLPNPSTYQITERHKTADSNAPGTFPSHFSSFLTALGGINRGPMSGPCGVI